MRHLLAVLLYAVSGAAFAGDVFSVAFNGMLGGQRWTRTAWATEPSPRFVFLMRGSVVDVRKFPAREYFVQGDHVVMQAHWQTCRVLGTAYFDCTPWSPSNKDMLVADWELAP